MNFAQLKSWKLQLKRKKHRERCVFHPSRDSFANGQWKELKAEKEVHDRIMASEKPGNITLSGVAIPMNRAQV
jgi:hypothetical protein